MKLPYIGRRAHPLPTDFAITLDNSRDSNLTPFGKATLTDRYLMPGETFQMMFGRVACAYASDAPHAQRLYDYMSKLWFMPATPVLSNGGTDRGLPISCFLNAVDDSLEGIDATYSENMWLAARGGGIGTYWGNVRSIGEKIGQVGESSGIVPFIKVQDSMTLGISQGSLRRGSAAVYLDVDHPEIEEFIDIRRPTGDVNRRSLNIHHGVNISDDFMYAVKFDEEWALKSPKTKETVRTVSARALWQRILITRLEVGEPYMLFIDTVRNAQPEHHKKLGLKVQQSNLCSEITLPTGVDHLGNDRTAVCCLSSVNVETYLEWKGNRQFLKDVAIFADNVLQDFIDRTDGVKGFEKARYAAARERSIGIGVMGFHSLLQRMDVPFEGVAAQAWNKSIFTWLYEQGREINKEVGEELGSNPDAIDAGYVMRWSHMFAIAPTASISIICGTTSACVEPIPTNIYTQKTLSGSFTVKNKFLDALLKEIARTEVDPAINNEEWVADQWSQILLNNGSVANLDCLTRHQKDVFLTAFELDQRWVIAHAANRAPLIDQAASNNIYLPGNVSVWDLHHIHFQAWEKGLKSLYYCRSRSVQRAENVGHMAGEMPQPEQASRTVDYDECLSCQ
jgi:ribonucleoside-diphosphate reductase alpha chain